ncbi:MAG: magnesium transporter MgtE N-terminal domain-containing protein [Betaproteobacteria bacterium]
MPEIRGLSTAFAESHPADAARVLEALPAEDTAAFIEALAPRVAAPILRQVGPPYGARVAGLLDESHAVAVIQHMGPQSAAQLVQHMAAERQLKVLAHLPVGTSIAIRLLVGYPRGTCGAYMDPWPLALAPDMTVADALEQIRKLEGELGDALFVSSGQRRLCGVLSLGELLRVPSREQLSAIMRPAVHTVSALATVTVAASHPGWDDARVLPVVERENRLVGALHRRALSAALAAPATPRTQPSAASGIFAAYWQTVSALTEIAVGALPPVPPIAEERSNHDG